MLKHVCQVTLNETRGHYIYMFSCHVQSLQLLTYRILGIFRMGLIRAPEKAGAL